MNFIEFFKSLFVARKMTKYRYMSVLISLIIFVLSVNLISFPMNRAIENEFPNLMKEYNLLALQEIKDSFESNPENEEVLNDISSYGCAVSRENFQLVCENLEEGTLIEKEIVFEKEGITKKINFIIDYNKEEELHYKLDDIPFKIKDYPYVDNEEIYFIILYPQGLYYQAHQSGIFDKKITHNDNQLRESYRLYRFSYQMQDLNLNYGDKIELIRMTGDYLTEHIVASEVKGISDSSFMGLFLVLLILPLIFVFIFWLFFKKTGKITRFKEYFNIAAITSIGPVLLTFIIMWFLPKVIDYYMYLFSLIYLFNLYKINSGPEIDDSSIGTVRIKNRKTYNNQNVQEEPKVVESQVSDIEAERAKKEK